MPQVRNVKPTFIKKMLSKAEWQALKNEHEEMISAIVDPYLQQKQHHQKDVILDFLFDYYAFRPSHLKKWSPGFGVMLNEATAGNFQGFDAMSFTAGGAFLNPEHFPAHRKQSAQWVLSLLEKSLQQKPSFGCFGMHEWAMVYKADKIRHTHLSLRIPPEELAAFVESRPLACTHFDAFRHFTESAKPLNNFELNRERFAQTEQAGCLHTNMDLYKWAFKMYPWIGSGLIRKAFLLALKTRKIDMKASPYDLREQGLKPIKIESKQGRKEYLKLQKEIYRKSVPIRKQLIEEYEELLAVF